MAIDLKTLNFGKDDCCLKDFKRFKARRIIKRSRHKISFEEFKSNINKSFDMPNGYMRINPIVESKDKGNPEVLKCVRTQDALSLITNNPESVWYFVKEKVKLEDLRCEV